MKMHREMTCEEFSARMAQLVASGEDIFAHPHVRRCKVHRALLEDLEAIAQVARQLFPDTDPSDALWQRIEDQIATVDEFREQISDPFSGFRLVTRIRVKGESVSRLTSKGHENRAGRGGAPGTRLKVGGPETPPCHGEGR